MYMKKNLAQKRMLRNSIIVIAGVIIVVFVVQQWKGPMNEMGSAKLPAGSPVPGSAQALYNTTWVWGSMVKGTTPVTPKKAGVFTLTLTPDGKVNAKTDCNNVSGTYQVGSDGVISFSTLSSTKKFCEGSQEAEFTMGLNRVRSYTIDASGNLTLFFANDAGAMNFVQ